MYIMIQVNHYVPCTQDRCFMPRQEFAKSEGKHSPAPWTGADNPPSTVLSAKLVYGLLIFLGTNVGYFDISFAENQTKPLPYCSKCKLSFQILLKQFLHAHCWVNKLAKCSLCWLSLVKKTVVNLYIYWCFTKKFFFSFKQSSQLYCSKHTCLTEA